MTIITLFSALFISAVAGYFSIAGLIAIFPGAPIAVGVMGTALEIGKLVSASWIYRFWNKTNLLMRVYFISAVTMLSLITSIGIFGYLTRAYVEGTQGLNANSEQIALLDEQMEMERNTVAASRAALQQLDVAVNRLISDSIRVERGVQIRNSQRRERTDLNNAIVESNKRIQQLQQEKAELNVGQRKLETEVGPIKYVAQLVYGSDDTTTIDKSIRLLILMLIFVFDPLAILLLIGANLSMKKNVAAIIPPTKNLADSLNKENVMVMNDEWSPTKWFQDVKRPK